MTQRDLGSYTVESQGFTISIGATKWMSSDGWKINTRIEIDGRGASRDIYLRCDAYRLRDLLLLRGERDPVRLAKKLNRRAVKDINEKFPDFDDVEFLEAADKAAEQNIEEDQVDGWVFHDE